jgi:hypothetical protein
MIAGGNNDQHLIFARQHVKNFAVRALLASTGAKDRLFPTNRDVEYATPVGWLDKGRDSGLELINDELITIELVAIIQHPCAVERYQ